MTNTISHNRLNQLLIDLCRSLLQYATEVSPWSANADGLSAGENVERLARHQRQSVERLAEYLDAHGHQIDFGVFPDEYTSLHFVGLDYLLRQMVVNQEAITQECRDLVMASTADARLHAMLSAIRDREERTLGELQNLTASIPA